MGEITLLEAHARLVSRLDGLCASQRRDFETWLKPALARDLRAGLAEATERMTGARRRLAQEFVHETAPAVVRDLNRGAERDILDALRSYEARFEPPPPRQQSLPDYRWRPSLWRTAIGAAFGAVMGVVLLAIEHVGAVPPAPSPALQQVAPAPPAAPADPAGAPTSPGPSREAAPPAPAQPPAAAGIANSPLLWLLAAFAAALGAAIGAVLAAGPPLQVVLQRAGLRGGVLSFVQKFGKTFGGILLLLRGSAFIVLAAALLSALFGVIAWMFSGAKIAQIVLVLMALATIFAARWSSPGDTAPDRDAIEQSLVDQLTEYLRADAEVWAALAAALVLRPQAQIGPIDPEPARLLKEVVDIIESRRQLGEQPDNILQVIEQNLGLQSGQRAHSPPQSPAGFVWQREHADAYDAFGIVEIGDTVRVTQRPIFITEPDGSRRVSKKGVVTRKV